MKVGDIHKLENNIHAGVKYLRLMADRYYTDPGIDPIDRMLFAFASYNAGPSRMARMRSQAAKEGYDKNLWFNNVELTVARHVGREPVHYVSNIYKYYAAYKMLESARLKKQKLKR